MNKIWTKPFTLAWINNFFVFLVFYALLTILPVFAINELHQSDASAALMTTIFLVSCIAIRPLAGKVTDRFGKGTTIRWSVFFFAALAFIYPFVHSFPWMLALRFFHGIPFSLATTALGAVAADLVPTGKKGEGLGYFVMSMNVAVVLGPFIALTAVQYMSYTNVFTLLAFLLLLAYATSFGILSPRSKTITSNRSFHLKHLFEIRSIPIACIGFLTAFSYASVISFISVYAQTIGLFAYVNFFFVVFAAAMIFSRPFTGRLFDTSGPTAVIPLALIVFAAGLMLLSMTDTIWMLLLCGVFIGLGYGSLLPCYQTMAVQAATPERSSYATATFFSFFDSGIAVGSFALGIVAVQTGYSHLYMGCALFLLLPLIGYLLLHFRNKRQLASNRV
ncbi:MFS transporter [Aureibacillus halotolerans]|uniref:Putative MFS family arabinose efflux permease n=1 Tax=Aureibacillus halotolerans TaxID=1508390 RepID=A0A4R6TYZ0_9BACI|nr:MFS transporter [Aureibacillus halotolerans]TDQ37185.1 putative MFS family arabinose efflux permease [Aureibacillus halotolerans]